jgi:hypothetical protein
MGDMAHPPSPIQTASSMRQPGVLVYLAGVATSALTLWGVNIALQHDVNILGWYVNAIIPVGALFIGIASGSGYALASYKFNIKLTKSFVLGMLTTGLIDYVAAQYLNYTSLLEQHHATTEMYGFLQFLRDQCESMTFSSTRSGSSPTELGSFGYFFKALEIAGFAGGTMIPSAALFAMPYCRGCQLYLKKHQQGYISSEMTRKQLFDTPRKTRKDTLGQLVGELVVRGGEFGAHVKSMPLDQTVEAMNQLLATGVPKDAAAHTLITLKKCPRCDGHHVNITVNYTNLDRKQGVQKVVDLDKTELQAQAAA